MKKIFVLGASGHAKVIIDIVKCASRETGEEVEIEIYDDNPSLLGETILGYPVAGRITGLADNDGQEAVIAIGNNRIRKKIAQEHRFNYRSFIHPNSVVAEDVMIGEGTVIMAGAIVNSGSVIGKHCIVNTAATVDHDNKIGDFVHISPGAHLAGTVEVDELSWIGTGANVKNNVTIGEGIQIGAGGVVISDLLQPGTYVGVPVRKIK